MRILYLSSLGFHDRWFLSHLDRAGHEVLSVRVYGADGKPDLGEARRIRHEEMPEPSVFAAARKLNARIAEFRPEVLQAGWLGDSGVLAALTGFHPLLLTPYGSDVLLNPSRSAEDRWQARLALRCADAVTVDSETVARRIEALSGFPFDRIVRFPWGIDLERFRPSGAVREQRRALVATRTLEPVYGTDLLLRALAESGCDAALVLAGDGRERPALEALARELGLEGRVRFLGRVANGDLPEVLRSADLYVTGALSDGTSRSLMEAMACGLPVVVPDVPAYAEWVRDGVEGAVYRTGDAASLAAALKRMLARPSDGFREAVLAVAREHFDERKNLRRLEGMYAALARGERAPALVAGAWAGPSVEERRWPSFKARLAEWGVVAALWRRAAATARSGS